MEILDMDPGPCDPTLLHLQFEHRSTEIWRLGGGDAQRCRRSNPNKARLPELHHNMLPLLQSTGFYGITRISSLQLDWGLISALVERRRPETHTFHLPVGECSITLQDVEILTGLAVDGEPVIGATPSADEAWPDFVGSVFGHFPPSDRFNGSRLQLSWFDTFIPKKLDDNASDEEIRHYTRSYLLHLIAGSMFTDHSGGLVHCMWIPYLRDLDACGKYAWGDAVLAFLYRELCKCCKLDRDEMASCLILLQLWAWERLPSIAPLRTNHSLVDDQFWAGQLAGPLGLRWLVRHSFSEKNGRTLPVYRVILDDIGPSHFIWNPYPVHVLDLLPAYCLIGQKIWRYCGPLICIFIVEPHQPNKVLRQFGMFQHIPDNPEFSTDLHRLTLQGNVSVNWVQKH
ncbi:serine/threonine-protein phosphatase 7 long form homolog [Apium graveolens]|uniref:serine/threonine-protein phosphatase 7 long form homolog n=1 Tax=Apium graveolens TaxID=4045 RepID=UPI003D7BD7DA